VELLSKERSTSMTKSNSMAIINPSDLKPLVSKPSTRPSTMERQEIMLVSWLEELPENRLIEVWSLPSLDL
jgi:hypothetical protein